MLQRLFGYLSSDLAVDLGTVNTLVSVAGEGLVLDEPSVVAVENRTNRILSGGCAVGHLARQMLGRTPESISVVRPLSEGVITDFVLCEAMLRFFLRKSQPAGACIPGEGLEVNQFSIPVPQSSPLNSKVHAIVAEGGI